MKLISHAFIKDREQAGHLLGLKLNIDKSSEAVVIANSRDGIGIASEISEAFLLPLDIMSCKKIFHPVDSKRSIGSVSINDVFLHDCPYSIPQSYIHHQITQLRNAIEQERFLYGNQISLLHKTVIIVDDILENSDTMIANIRGIKKQQPLKVIIAVPIIETGAMRILKNEVEEIVFLKTEEKIAPIEDYYLFLPKIGEEKVKDLLQKSKARKTHIAHQLEFQ